MKMSNELIDLIERLETVSESLPGYLDIKCREGGGWEPLDLTDAHVSAFGDVEDIAGQMAMLVREGRCTDVLQSLAPTLKQTSRSRQSAKR